MIYEMTTFVDRPETGIGIKQPNCSIFILIALSRRRTLTPPHSGSAALSPHWSRPVCRRARAAGLTSLSPPACPSRQRPPARPRAQALSAHASPLPLHHAPHPLTLTLKPSPAEPIYRSRCGGSAGARPRHAPPPRPCSRGCGCCRRRLGVRSGRVSARA